MAKYVCDFDQVIAAGDKLCSTASEMTTVVSNYATKVTSDLSSWTGSAKASFTTQCEGQVQIATANASIERLMPNNSISYILIIMHWERWQYYM